MWQVKEGLANLVAIYKSKSDNMQQRREDDRTGRAGPRQQVRVPLRDRRKPPSLAGGLK